MRILAVVIISILISFGCSTSKPAMDGFTGGELRFGKYGGYAGEYVDKMIYSNGKTFFKRNKKSKYIPGESISEKDAQRIFSNFKTFGLDTMKVDDPGGLTYFVECKMNGKKYKLKWGGNSKKLDPKVQMFYTVIRDKVKKKEVVR